MGLDVRISVLACLGFVATSGIACKDAGGGLSLSKGSGPSDEEAAKVPVPPENGPKLTALSGDVVILERPRRDARPVGGLLFGAPVARAERPFASTDECKDGWFPVRPRGFVCASDGVSLDGAELAPPPTTGAALPYRYATARTTTPAYSRIPTAEEQMENEPSLDSHLAKADRERNTELRAGALDVPIDERGVATGIAFVRKNGVGVGSDGRRTRQSYFETGELTAPPVRAGAPLVARVLRKGAGLGFVGSVTTEGPRGPRRFVIASDGVLVPVDRLDPALGSTWHGVDLSADKNLPLGFVLKHEAHPYQLSKSAVSRVEDEELERRSAVFLTGRFRTVDGVRYEETLEGTWLRERDLIKVVKRSKFPDFVNEGTRWIDVSVALQTMTLYEGRKPVYTTLVSTGRDVLGDPSTSASTPQGSFPVQRASLLTPLDEREVDQAFEPRDAPFGIEFAPGASIVAHYWSDNAGEARTFHNIALTPVDAFRVFEWVGLSPSRGLSWQSVTDSPVTVHVRK
jgi:hypothetical protein